MYKYNSAYDSQMREIIIPLLGFREFHHTNNNNDEHDDLDDFIGRESIIKKLQAWLEEKKDTTKKYSGAYLITGFRGMGKSSFVHKAIQDMMYKTKKKSGCYYVPISINVGNDLLTSKELLYIICKLLSAEFEKKTRLKENLKSRLNVFIFQFISFISFVFFLWLTLWGDLWGLYAGVSCLFFFMFIYTNQICNGIWKLTNCSKFITVWQIKKMFDYLEERIDSETTLTKRNEFNAKAGYKVNLDEDDLSVGFGYKNVSGKKRIYPIAHTPEIQDLLVNQLSLIKKLPFAKFRFIFVIDELDKVSPEDNEKQIVPEYDSTNVVNGNSTYRSRQKALAGLLANMKYFISSSEAKFIFITGYDMYEASLADISNREFNLHSIFNGQINVSSFFRKAGNSKGADSLIEEFLCHALLKKGREKEQRKDLYDYSNYYLIRWDEFQKDRYEKKLERRIIFIRHFLTYLFYMSNGSPKKLAIYMEKYIRSQERIKEKYEENGEVNWNTRIKEITLGINTDENCQWYLYFDERSIHKIEFINYIIYPMIKNLIAKSSIYNDKLLVSTSFMISNLYKFHKSGFSLRNLEYMPELLDINKTPELRDFIGGILQFLNQTHIDEAVINLYKFKFPLRLSEEITFFSKTAEETSYLFNFSHDELLSIKKLYNQQLEHYTNVYYESPAVASVRHMLGDIYMLEENYEQAIFEFNEARKAIHRQKDEEEKNSTKDFSHILFLIRVSLKLGLAYEKRKTFDTAYVTYEKLIEEILNMAKDAKFFGRKIYQTTDIIGVLKSNSSFFSNIRIMYLGILAKIAVLEKMDLGGIRDKDMILLYKEFEQIYTIADDEIRPLSIIDFFTKLGDILYFKGCNEKKWISDAKDYIGYMDCDDIIKECQQCEHKKKASPCCACLYYRISINRCLKELKTLSGSTNDVLELLEILYDEKRQMEITIKGNLFMMAMANALVGLGNTQYGCAGVENNDSMAPFFQYMNKHFFSRKEEYDEKTEAPAIDKAILFNKSQLYYLAAAKTYELLTDHKSAYNIYVQMLDAIYVFYQAYPQKQIPDETINFCKELTKQAINCTYWHYDNINCAEIDTIKHELAKKQIDQINLQYLSSYPEIEVAIYKYYSLCLLGDIYIRNSVLRHVLNSRQLGQDKLVATLTQNIQNLYFKVLVNEDILSRIIPKLYDSIKDDNHSLADTINYIADYYYNADIDSMLCQLNWGILDDVNDVYDKRFCLLDYLIKDSLFCLNRITELIAPLYSTTLYNNAFIGEIFEITFNWNHLLICMREIFEFTEATEKDSFLYDLKNRCSIFNKNLDDPLRACGNLLSILDSWKKYNEEGKSKVETLYEKVCPHNNNYLTSTYLTGNAVDFFNRSLEMHSSGKSYKEMITTLFFLEDDLHNDSNYLNYASEVFIINAGYVSEKIKNLNKYSLEKSHLLEIDNYIRN